MKKEVKLPHDNFAKLYFEASSYVIRQTHTRDVASLISYPKLVLLLQRNRLSNSACGHAVWDSTWAVGAMWAFAFAALALQGGQLGGDLLLDSALLVQLVGGADQVDWHLGFGG